MLIRGDLIAVIFPILKANLRFGVKSLWVMRMQRWKTADWMRQYLKADLWRIAMC